MRITLVCLLAAAGWAQPPAAPAQAPAPAVPQVSRLLADLDPVNRLINDFGNARRYAADNQSVKAPAPGEERVVFMGDSITDGWGRMAGSSFFPGKPYINRGISGQVTAQMLLRFHADVIALKPVAVVIFAGTNDIGGNIGPVTMESTEENLMAMAEMARGNGIQVVMASLTPVCDYIRPQTQSRPPEKIVALNRWIEGYVARNNLVYLDYYSATIDEKNMFRKELTYDGLHPNVAGYEVMGPLALKAIAAALGK
jgi:lysophospholipase L1-like esterase